MSFFIGQPHPFEDIVNGGYSAGDTDSLAQFFEGHIRLLTNQLDQAPAMGLRNLRLASRVLVSCGDIPRSTALLKQFLHHPERHSESSGDLFTGSFARVVGRKNSFT